jgi:hypothetical protein
MTVFHPGHDALHGFTVVVFSKAERTYAGRWDAVDGDVVWLNDAVRHDPAASEVSREEFLRRLAMFGPVPEHRRLAVPRAEITDVQRLGDWIRARGGA